jgi:thymidylate synthase (FAD)
LAKLERICRVAYKSEDKIDDGKDTCPECEGKGYVLEGEDAHVSTERACLKCEESGEVQVREPSSHKLIRRILKTGRRNVLKRKVEEWLRKFAQNAETFGGEKIEVDCMAADVVDLVLNDLRDDPPHESVIEHESITVLFTSNRGFTHELVRHRLCAFTQESTRYCNYSKGKFGSAITVTKRNEDLEKLEMMDEWMEGVGAAQQHYMALVEQGVKPQIARDLLPQVLKADIVITANLREWRHIFKMRCSPKAHPDMRRLMIPLRDELRSRIPIIFDEV